MATGMSISFSHIAGFVCSCIGVGFCVVILTHWAMRRPLNVERQRSGSTLFLCPYSDHTDMSINSPQIIQLPRVNDIRGNLSFFESENQLPFDIKRVHWIYDVPGGETRGGVAYKTTEEFIVAMSGSFDVKVHDGEREYKFSLNRSYMGVFIPKGMWRSIENYSTNSIAVIAASTHYEANDGIREFSEFKQYVTEKASIFDTSELPNAPSIKHESISNVYDSTMLEFDRHHSNRKGDICVVENGMTIPFDVKRLYYLYDVPGGESRGGHAHKNLSQLIIAASGSFAVTLDDGNVKRTFTLNRPYQGLYIKPGIWRELYDFSSGSVCLVLASDKYDETDYIRDYKDFLNYRKI